MARINNKINLPTNTTDIKMLANYLSAIEEQQIVSVDAEQELFSKVKAKYSRKKKDTHARDTHTKAALSLYGLINVTEDGSFSVSPLGKEVVNCFSDSSNYSREDKLALMLKVFVRMEIVDDPNNRHIHIGFIILKLLCDSDLDYYITNQELAHMVMNPAFISDEQYGEIKQYVLDFRENSVGISQFAPQTKAATFMTTFVTNWEFMTSEDTALNQKQAKLADKYFAAWLNQEDDDNNAESEEDIELSQDTEAAEISTTEKEANQTSLTASQNNAKRAYHSIIKYRLNTLSAYIAKLYLFQLEGTEIKDYLSYFTGNKGIKQDSSNMAKPIQKIYYGAPGTGKSNAIKLLTGPGKDGIKFSKNYTFRTTFHPDSDYSSFVGAYKPTISKNMSAPIIDQTSVENKFVNEVDINDPESIFCFGEKYWKSLESINIDLNGILLGSDVQIDKIISTLKKGLESGRNRSFDNTPKIIYDFRPQTFLKAYVAAWTHPEQNVALVIEEINRGNCAQVFGDIFQLLDREDDGISKYPIEADVDMKDFLKRAFNNGIAEPWAGSISEDEKDSVNIYYADHYDNAFEKIKNGDILALPKNLSFLATMNTSDQSLFPMDSAFKRRWEWEYQQIDNANKSWKIRISDKYELIDWWKFLERINKVIADLTTSEDKQLGYFFCMPDDKEDENRTDLTIISAKTFVGKVIFYLWNDVFKDYAFDAPCCKGEDEKEVLYAKFYEGNSINTKTLAQFFEKLKEGNDESLLKEIKTEGTSETESVVETDPEAITVEEITSTEGEAESAEVTPSTQIE